MVDCADYTNDYYGFYLVRVLPRCQQATAVTEPHTEEVSLTLDKIAVFSNTTVL